MSSISEFFFFISEERRSISSERVRSPTFFAEEPPVKLPPGFMTCPSQVTIFILKPLFSAILVAAFSSVATTVLPSRSSMIPVYFSLYFARSEAI
ncbi:MAG TPA: hypothetical protein DD733_12485, partial [Clostridiales bacterium]|nr:hypothetical protein [Clostridiales bacterium]